MRRDAWRLVVLVGLIVGFPWVVAPPGGVAQEPKKGSGARVEGRAGELLEGYKKGFAQGIRTVDQTLSLVSYDERGGAASKWKGRMVVDFRGRRAMIEALGTKMEKDEDRSEERIVLLPEKAYLIKRGDVEELTQAQRLGFEIMFREAARDFLPIDTEGVQYEREAKYGDLVAGEQVKGRPMAKTHEPLASLRLVFDRQGRLLAVVREFSAEPADGGEQGAGLRPRHDQPKEKGKGGPRITHPRLQLTRFKEPVAPGELKKFGNKSIYTLDREGSKPRLVAESRVERLAINEPVDEALFRVDTSRIDKDKPKAERKKSH